MKKFICTMIIVLVTSFAYGAPTVQNSAMYQQEGSEYKIFRGNINLPAEGSWEITDSAPAKDIVQLYMVPSKEKPDIMSNRRMQGITKQNNPLNNPPTDLSHTIIAVCKQGMSGKLSLTLKNMITDVDLDIKWDISQSKSDETVLADLKKARLKIWKPYVKYSNSPVLQTWLSSYEDDKDNARRIDSQRRRGRGTSIFGLLGGRAAVQETLQLQSLNVDANKGQEQAIPIDTIKGIEVKAHPYEEMLKGNEGGKLSLANMAPDDSFFIYVAKPKTIIPFLDEGAEFFSVLGETLTGNSIKYNLKSKYLSRLGLDNQWLNMFLESGAVKESALVFPDLFFIDGTEVTIISRLTKVKLIEPLLKLAGVKGLSKQDIVTRDLGNGQNAYWALRDDLLFISTNKFELDAVLQLQKNGGENSLGQSSEFRYMLTQLPVKEDTRIYAYFSDPFIRNMVGPRTKIAQLRRMMARADMEYLTSCILLAKLDGRNITSMEALVNQGYAPESYLSSDYSLGKDMIIRSKTYDTLSNLKAISETPVTMVTQQEANAYKGYVDNYTRYWRRFFDPIAIRIDDIPENALEMTTFILPLIDNSFYNSLRQVMLSQEDNIPMKTPIISPEPTLMLSVNLREQSWQNSVKGFSGIFREYANINLSILDDLGTGIHLAIHDANPVIALGSGNILGVFGSSELLQLGRNKTFFIPALLSILTRPCTLIVETQNPAKTRRHLKELAISVSSSQSRQANEFNVEFYQVGEHDEWILSLNIAGIIKLRYGLEIQDDFLFIRNIPWSNKDKVVQVGEAPLNSAGLQIYPRACNLQLPGLYTTASESYRSAALQGMGYLYPLVVSDYASMDDAAKKHAKLFGFNSSHPEGGYWLWDNYQLTSSQYGSIYKQKQPAYTEGDRNFGLLKDIDHLNINMQFEDTGLRTKIRWKVK